MKHFFASLLPAFIVGLNFACDEKSASARESIHPVSDVVLLGKAVDTVFLFQDYADPGVSVHEKEGCEFERIKSKEVNTQGQVDTRIPGQYILNYTVWDGNRNKNTVLSRTVHVVPNSSTFLNGIYKATCSCTAIAQGASSPSLTSGQYTAMVSSSGSRDEFALSDIKIGPVSATAKPLLIGDSIHMGYFSPYYHQMAYYSGSGNLLRAKNTFTLRTRVIPYDTKITYDCINTYTRQLKIDAKVKK